MPTIIRLAHVALRTSNIEALTRHYRDAIGLARLEDSPDGRRHLTADGLGASIELIEVGAGQGDGLDHVAWELAPGTDLAAVRAELAQAGLEAGDALEDPGVAAALTIQDPDGVRLQLTVPDDARQATPVARRGAAPDRLGHVAITVAEGAVSRAFYERVFGFRWSDAIGPVMEFLRHGADHHSLNLVAAPHGGALHHVAFETRDTAHLLAACDALAAEQVRIAWGPGRHGAGHNAFTYHHAPDGHIVELYCDMDRMSSPEQGYFDPRPWHTERPQRPRVWRPDEFAAFNAWGAGPPESMRG